MKTTKEIGAELESAFAKYMKDELGYSSTKQNVYVQGKLAKQSIEVDVHGIIKNKFYENIKTLGYLITVIACVQLFLGIIPEVEVALENLFTSISPGLAGFSLLIFGALGIYIGLTGSKNSIEHTWVECKNMKSKVTRNHIATLSDNVIDHNQQYENVKEKGEDVWFAKKMIFVSKSGFNDDALNRATDKGIICYLWNGKKKFTKIN